MATKAKDGGHGEALRSLEANRFLTIASRLPQGGSLQARKLQGGAIQFYWRYSYDAVGFREPVGFYDPKSPPKQLTPTAQGFSIAAALEACKTLAVKHSANALAGGLKTLKAAEAEAYKAVQLAAQERSAKTLSSLIATYVDYLKAQKRKSFYEAEQVFRLHFAGPFPKVAAKPATQVTPDEILDALRKLVEDGKGRSANKLRSYIRAAYQCAIDVRSTASIPIAFKTFDVVVNPAAQTKRDAKFERADKNPLTLTELRTYWQKITSLEGMPGIALRSHLLSGGQRIEQVIRLRYADVKEDSFTIYDGKGRPGHAARPHVLPILPALERTLEAAPKRGDFVLSTDGKKHISNTTLSNWAQAAVGDSIAGFQLKRVRSGVETALAANGVSREIRGHLQSHGLTGVQARHYDGHDYMPEKRKALELLFELLEHKPQGKIVPIRTAGV